MNCCISHCTYLCNVPFDIMVHCIFCDMRSFGFTTLPSPLNVVEFSSLPHNNYLQLSPPPQLTSALVYKLLWNEAVNVSVTALCDGRWLVWWSRGRLLLELVWLPYPLSRVWKEDYKQFDWLHCLVSTDERFMGELRASNETPRYLCNLSNGCSVCESGRKKYVFGTLPTNYMSRILHEKLIGPQLVKKFHGFYGTHNLIITVTRACHLCPSPEPNQSSPCLPFLMLEDPY